MAKEANKILRRKYTKKALAVVLCAAAIIIGAFGGVVWAKYMIEKNKYATVASPNFYFESDILTTSGGSYYLSSTTESISITLKNSADALRISELDVHYTVSITGSATLDKTGGVLQKAATPRNEVITVSNIKAGETYTITATGYTMVGGEVGFSKTLSIDIEVEESSARVYKHLDVSGENYVVLTVWTKNLKGSVEVDFPDGLIPDNTNPGMESVKTTDGEFTHNDALSAYSSQTYRFFKESSLAVTAEDFEVTLIDGAEQHEALVGTP